MTPPILYYLTQDQLNELHQGLFTLPQWQEALKVTQDYRGLQAVLANLELLLVKVTNQQRIHLEPNPEALCSPETYYSRGAGNN